MVPPDIIKTICHLHLLVVVFFSNNCLLKGIFGQQGFVPLLRDCDRYGAELGVTGLRRALRSCSADEMFSSRCCAELNGLFGPNSTVLKFCLCHPEVSAGLFGENTDEIESGLKDCGVPFFGSSGMSFSCPVVVLPDIGDTRSSGPADLASTDKRSNALSPVNGTSSEVPGQLAWTARYVADPRVPYDYYGAGRTQDNKASSMALSSVGANQVDEAVDGSLFRRKDKDEASVTTRISKDSFTEKDGDYYKSVGGTQFVLFDLFGQDRSRSKQHQQQKQEQRFQDDTMIAEDLSTKYSTMLLCPFQVAGRYPRPGMHTEHEHWYDLIATEAQVRF